MAHENSVFEKEKIQLLKGPYGPYIKQGLRNFKIPKEKQETAEALTLEEAKAIIEEGKANPPKKMVRKLAVFRIKNGCAKEEILLL